MERTTLQVARKQEAICIAGPDGEPLYEWLVSTDDASLQRMLNKVGNSFDRARDLAAKAEGAATPEEAREANEETVKLQKRVISAIVGEQGYQDILEYIGDGEPVDPYDYIIVIGDVFGALCVWLYERCTSKQLRDAGVYIQGEAARLRRGTRKPAYTAKRGKKKRK